MTAGPPRVSPELLAHITGRYGKPTVATVPDAGPDQDQAAAFEQLRLQLQGAAVVLFANVAPGNLDRFFRLRLAQILRREPPLPAISVVALKADPHGPRLAGGFADRFHSGWPFLHCVFVTEAGDQAALSAQIALTVGQLGPTWTPLRSQAAASQKIALQVQRIWGRCGSTTGFENQVESLVRAGFLTIRLFADAALRRGETLNARLAEIIPENNGHAGAHIDAIAVPEGPPIAIRAGSHAVYWATWLAATAKCRPRDPAVMEAARRADCVVANHLESVGTALALAPGARLMLDIRDDRARSTAEMMRRGGHAEADIQAAEAVASRVQAGVLAIPDICGHVSAEEFVRLAPQSQRAAIVRPRVYVKPVPPEAPRFDVLLFGDEHPFNITSVRWFLDEVWDPFLAAAGVSVAIAGRVGNHIRDRAAGSPLLHCLGFVEDLDALRAACRLTVVPDRHGTGTAVKTLTTLGAGHPMVCTSVALRGLEPAIAALVVAHDEPAAVARDIRTLLRDPGQLAERGRLVERARLMVDHGQDHASLLRWIPRPTPRIRRERAGKWARLTEAALARNRRPHHFALDAPFPMSGSVWDAQVLLDGWHAAEEWGRWTDGARASFRLTLAAPAPPGLTLELDIVPPPADAVLSVTVDDFVFPSVRPLHGPHAWKLPAITRGKSSFLVALNISATFCPARSGDSSDARILGIGVSRIRVRLDPP